MAARAKRTSERKLKRSTAATTVPAAPRGRRAKPGAKPTRERAPEVDALAKDDDS
jgi:hypothetical protein